MNKSLLLLIAILFLFQHSNCSTGIKVDRESSFFLDPQGYVRIFHGVNVVYKTAPYYPPYDIEFTPLTSFNEQDAQNLFEWGFNMIRLDISWEGVEPIQGQYNQTYIEQVQNIVEICGKHNINVFLDMHQDLYTSYFCGEGVPLWLVENNLSKEEIESFPLPLDQPLERDAQGIPLTDSCKQQEKFGNYYQSRAVNKLSQDILSKQEIIEQFGNFWEYVAKNFKDYDNIFGYEIMNEPWGADIYTNPAEKLEASYQNNELLLPFYNQINQKIRDVDRETLVMYESFDKDHDCVGFDAPVGGEQYGDRDVLSYHMYCHKVQPNGEPIDQEYCQTIDKFQQEAREKNYKETKIGGFISEFGALGDTEGCIQEVDRVTNNADEALQSWTYWQYKYYNDITTAAPSPGIEGFWREDGSLQEDKVAALARSYAYRICGIPLKMDWNKESQIFHLEVQINKSQCNIGGTEIYLSEQFWYENGFTVDFEGCNNCRLQPIYDQLGYYMVWGDFMIADGKTLSITVSPKKSEIIE